MIGLGLVFKIFPFASGISIAMAYPEETKSVIDTLTPIGLYLKDSTIAILVYIGGLVQ